MKTDFNDLFLYQCNGDLVNKVQRSPRSRIGCVAGFINDSRYVVTQVNGHKTRAHRIIWEMHFGAIPDGLEIDHINRNRSDNRIENLRLATRHEQNLNLSKRDNSAVTGVVFNKKDNRWQSQIGFNGKHIYLGQFHSKENAIEARKNAEVKYGFRSAS